MQVKWVKGHATMQHVCEGTISLRQLQANELADEQAQKGSACHPSVAQIEQSYNARASFWAGFTHTPIWRTSSSTKVTASPSSKSKKSDTSSPTDIGMEAQDDSEEMRDAEDSESQTSIAWQRQLSKGGKDPMATGRWMEVGKEEVRDEKGGARDRS